MTTKKSKSGTRTSGSGLALSRGVVLLAILCRWPGICEARASPTASAAKVIASLEEATGGRVEMAAFHWNLSQLGVRSRRPDHSRAGASRRIAVCPHRSRSGAAARHLIPGETNQSGARGALCSRHSHHRQPGRQHQRAGAQGEAGPIPRLRCSSYSISPSPASMCTMACCC